MCGLVEIQQTQHGSRGVSGISVDERLASDIVDGGHNDPEGPSSNPPIGSDGVIPASSKEQGEISASTDNQACITLCVSRVAVMQDALSYMQGSAIVICSY